MSSVVTGRRPFPVLLTLALGFVMAMLDVTAVNVALPGIALDLQVPLAGLVWVVDGYTLTFAALLLAGGALADRYGPKAVYQAGLALFLAGSALCAMAPDGVSLTAARLLQGAGAALFMPSSLSLLTHSYEDPALRTRMLGAWSALVGVAGASGPLVGGLLVHQFGWRSVFWINLPLGVLAIVMAQLLLAAPPKRPRALSLGSHALGVAALAGLSFVLIEGPVLGWLAPAVLLASGLTLASAAVLLQRERRGSHPLLPRELFQGSSFGAANGVGFLINFGVFGQLFLLSLYLQQGGSGDALQAGLRLLPMMAAYTVGNFMAGGIAARHGTRRPMLLGLLVAAAMAALLATLQLAAQQALPYGVLVPVAVLMNVAIGIAIPAMTATVMQVAGKAHANSAAAALNANRQVGALVGVALAGSMLQMAPGWPQRIVLAYAAVAVAYALAAGLVDRRIAVPTSVPA
ncbi:MFS transporter [Janthinobacterium aquaticum]|uniref:MFS transporter n=1 Tax=Janthinobacterium sp. FT58W TaxID=2654254 RepID=UPI001264ADC9|nr:MFS transporter [Janthinobacterium sp. FT58W]KAB8045329.1 MFS transporter [Janthinobacterium sp. FT58W]